ncbi:hypothetical protein P7D88_12110, partial [Enterococcus dongliensis]|nr:hypothetical protein [Enterococcus dongliensis]
IIGNPSLNHRYRKGFYSLFKTLQQNLRTASTTIKGMEAIRGIYKKSRKEGSLFGFSVCTEIKGLLGIPA